MTLKTFFYYPPVTGGSGVVRSPEAILLPVSFHRHGRLTARAPIFTSQKILLEYNCFAPGKTGHAHGSHRLDGGTARTFPKIRLHDAIFIFAAFSGHHQLTAFVAIARCLER